MFEKKDSKKDDVIEKTILKSSEKYRDVKRVFKFIFSGIFVILILFGFYLIFGVYIFGSFIISLLFSGMVFYNSIIIEYERFIECRIEFEIDPKTKEKKPRNRVLNQYKIPVDILKEFTLKGDTKVTFKTKSGSDINIVSKVNIPDKIIEYPWYAELSAWNFYIMEETFPLAIEKLKTQTRDLRRHEQTRDLHYSIEYLESIQDTTKDIDVKPSIAKLEDMIKYVYSDKVTKDEQDN